MATVHLLSDEEARKIPEAWAVFEDIRATRKSDFVNNFWRALANDPPQLKRVWEQLKQVMMADGEIPPLVREMIYIAVSTANGCSYCIHSHTAAARAKGMTDGQHAELLAVIGMAAQTNALVTAMQVPVDDAFAVKLGGAMATIPLFPLSNALFPACVLHLRIFEVRYLDMIRRCIADGSEFGVVALLAGNEVRSPEGHETLAAAGTLARIDAWDAPMPALLQLRCIGTQRFRLLSSQLAKYGLWMGETEPIDDDPPLPVPAPLQPCADALGRLVAQWQQEGVPADQMPVAPPYRLDECAWVADRWCELLPLPAAEKVRLLALTDPRVRLEAVRIALEGPQA